ncbi:MAG: primosomal protein N' [Clostridia bacterium]|nr:primosomal protein N' [Clostridia bacterium]
MIANVMLTESKHSINQSFDYLIPKEWESVIQPGLRVLVPFGVHNNSAEALVLSVKETSEFSRLKTLLRPLDQEPICTPELLQLCEWMQHRYFCSFQQAYRQIKPPYMGAKIRKWVIFQQTTEDKLTPTQQQFLDKLRELDGIAELEELEAVLNKKGLSRTAFALQNLGIVEVREQLDESISFLYIRKARLNPETEEGYALAEELRQRRAPVQADMVLALCENGDMRTSDLIAVTDGNYQSLNALQDKGIVTIYREKAERLAYEEDKYTPTKAYVPTEEQRPVIDHLNNLIRHQMHEKILLHGITGSGKTEIFLQAIDTCIQEGKQAIMLVPEISLTPQMVERFVSRFGSSVAVMHSGLSQGERFDQWHKIKQGKVHVVVGARSAVFAPFDKLGIIILDEEHESSYKSENAPRYHAREIAMYRGQKFGAPVLLASATPSISSYYYAKEGRYRLFEMQKRYNNQTLPEAQICDMRSELLDLHNLSAISTKLRAEIQKNLERGEKSILFLNRRGYNTFVSCRECGYVMECDQCSIALTYHRKSNQLVCHYCGQSHQPAETCPQCGSKYIKFFGTGTQKIEDELHTLFPDAKILRMDFDTTSQKGGHELILNQFRNGDADILLGTQMVTKGLDFPDVTLVGVLAADASLNVDDFRASERCFSLITQVCGRAGRGDLRGRAIIQTYQPDNSTIQFAKMQNYKEFYQNEILYRKRMQYPPFCDMLYILVSGENEETVAQEILNIDAFIKAHAPEDCIHSDLPPSPAPIAKIKNKFRYRLLIKAQPVQKLFPLLHQISLSHNESRTENSLVIDINPVNML